MRRVGLLPSLFVYLIVWWRVYLYIFFIIFFFHCVWVILCVLCWWQVWSLLNESTACAWRNCLHIAYCTGSAQYMYVASLAYLRCTRFIQHGVHLHILCIFLYGVSKFTINWQTGNHKWSTAIKLMEYLQWDSCTKKGVNGNISPPVWGCHPREICITHGFL